MTVNVASGAGKLTAPDVGADAAGAATGAVSTHIAAVDPHGDRAYALTHVPIQPQQGFTTSANGESFFWPPFIPSQAMGLRQEGDTVFAPRFQTEADVLALSPGFASLNLNQTGYFGNVDVGTLSGGPLVVGTPITSITLQANLAAPIPANAYVTLTSGSNVQVFQTSGIAAAAQAVINVSSQAPFFAFPTASTVSVAVRSYASPLVSGLGPGWSMGVGPSPSAPSGNTGQLTIPADGSLPNDQFTLSLMIESVGADFTAQPTEAASTFLARWYSGNPSQQELQLYRTGTTGLKLVVFTTGGGVAAQTTITVPAGAIPAGIPTPVTVTLSNGTLFLAIGDNASGTLTASNVTLSAGQGLLLPFSGSLYVGQSPNFSVWGPLVLRNVRTINASNTSGLLKRPTITVNANGTQGSTVNQVGGMFHQYAGWRAVTADCVSPTYTPGTSVRNAITNAMAADGLTHVRIDHIFDKVVTSVAGTVAVSGIAAGAVSSIPLTSALAQTVQAGDTIVVANGVTTDYFVCSATTSSGTAIPVTAKTITNSYPSGAAVIDLTWANLDDQLNSLKTAGLIAHLTIGYTPTVLQIGSPFTVNSQPVYSVGSLAGAGLPLSTVTNTTSLPVSGGLTAPVQNGDILYTISGTNRQAWTVTGGPYAIGATSVNVVSQLATFTFTTGTSVLSAANGNAIYATLSVALLAHVNALGLKVWPYPSLMNEPDNTANWNVSSIASAPTNSAAYNTLWAAIRSAIATAALPNYNSVSYALGGADGSTPSGSTTIGALLVAYCQTNSLPLAMVYEHFYGVGNAYAIRQMLIADWNALAAKGFGTFQVSTLHSTGGTVGSTALGFTWNGVAYTATVPYGSTAYQVIAALQAATGPNGELLPSYAFTATGGPYGTADVVITAQGTMQGPMTSLSSTQTSGNITSTFTSTTLGVAFSTGIGVTEWNHSVCNSTTILGVGSLQSLFSPDFAHMPYHAAWTAAMLCALDDGGVSLGTFTRMGLVDPANSSGAIYAIEGLVSPDASPRPLPAYAAMQAWWLMGGGKKIPCSTNDPRLRARATITTASQIVIFYSLFRPVNSAERLHVSLDPIVGLPSTFTWRRYHADQSPSVGADSTLSGADERGPDYRIRIVQQGNQTNFITGFGSTHFGFGAIVITPS